jgi:hypothetical protein
MENYVIENIIIDDFPKLKCLYLRSNIELNNVILKDLPKLNELNLINCNLQLPNNYLLNISHFSKLKKVIVENFQIIIVLDLY